MAKKKLKAMAKLEGNIVEHMRLVIELKDQQRKHFHYDSKLWKAIRDSVGECKGLVKHPEDHLFMTYRGSGKAISLSDVHLYARDHTVKPSVESKVFCMEVEVVYVHDDNTHMDHPPTVSKKTRLQVPIELALNFSKTKFNNWVKKVKAEREATEKEKDLAQLKELQAKYPEEI